MHKVPEIEHIISRHILKDYDVIIESPFEVSDELLLFVRRQAQNILDKQINALKIVLCIRKDLIGGVRVRIGDKVFDNSIRKKLKIIKKSMRSIGFNR